MGKVDIVEMTVADIDEVMVIENLCFTIPWSREAFILELTENKFSRYLCAKTEGMVVGYAGLWKVLDEGHITNIAVHPEFSGNGIGKQLMTELVSLAKREHIERMTLEVRKNNQVALALYSKFGFSLCGIRKSYYADNGEDAMIMWKEEMD